MHADVRLGDPLLALSAFLALTVDTDVRHDEFVDGHGTLRQYDIHTLPDEFVGPTTVDLD